jgi:heme-degrading monooxygenase HmoA
VITEHAILRVRSGQAVEFEAAMVKAQPLIAASPGFIDIEIRASCEEPNCYLLLVKWKDIASHRDGFRKSDRYGEWRALLHHFYDVMPEVSYFGEVL